MGFEHIRVEIKRKRVQIDGLQKDIQSLAKAVISTASAEVMLARMLEKIDELCADRDRLVGEERLSRPSYASGKSSTTRRPVGETNNLRKFTPPWDVQEGDDQCFRIYDATGFFICSVSHRDDLQARAFQYADNHLKREEARRIYDATGFLSARYRAATTCTPGRSYTPTNA